MIFVTVGTHEQQFNRLISEVDRLKGDGVIEDEVFIQVGYSDYIPQYCNWTKFILFDEMESYINRARIVITHGGPASFIGVLSKGKTPIVVPRRFDFQEHVNNHQLDFANKLINRGVNFILVNEIEDLQTKIKDYNTLNGSFISHNNKFNERFSNIINNMFN